MADEALLLQLALQAIDDPDAQLVLEDALQERGPSIDVRVDRMLIRNSTGLIIGTSPLDVQVTIDGTRYVWSWWPTWRVNDDFEENHFARALAAVLLFREWSAGSHPWPVVRRALIPSIAPPRLGFTRENFRRLVHNYAVMHGYGSADIEVSEQGPGQVRVHIAAPVPDTVLAVIESDLLQYVPVYLRLEVTAQGDPRDDLEIDTDGRVALRTA